MIQILAKGEDLEKEFKKIKFKIDNNKIYDVEIKIHRKIRSLNANSYLWELVGQIANLIGSTKEEVYLKELKRYGQSLLIPVEIDKEPDGFFKYYEFRQRGRINNKACDWYVVYKGSSQYDTKEMSVLLNGVVSDCKELDIPTLDDYRINQLIKDWEG